MSFNKLSGRRCSRPWRKQPRSSCSSCKRAPPRCRCPLPVSNTHCNMSSAALEGTAVLTERTVPGGGRSPSPPRRTPPGAGAFLTPLTSGSGRARSPPHQLQHPPHSQAHTPLHAHAHKPRALEPAVADDTADLEELEHFAKTFKQRRIKLGECGQRQPRDSTGRCEGASHRHHYIVQGSRRATSGWRWASCTGTTSRRRRYRGSKR